MSAPRNPDFALRKRPLPRRPHPLGRAASAARAALVPPLLACALAVHGPASGQLLPEDFINNLRAFPVPIPLGDPELPAALGEEGPKGIATADFNRDGRPDVAVSNWDGTVTILAGIGGGDFAPAVHLRPGAHTLRGIVAADVDGDGDADLATAAPFDGVVFLYFNDGEGAFGPPEALPAWTGARDLAAGDFDGDGVMDLAAAGPGHGLRHYRGTGGGEFEVVVDIPELGPPVFQFPKPVFALRALPVAGAEPRRDELLVIHALSGRAWLLGTELPSAGDGGADPLLQGVPLGQGGFDSPLVITEIMADNDTVLADAEGDFEDWIEIFNRSNRPVDLGGWALEDGNNRWVFPGGITLDPGRFLVVFASNQAREFPGGEIHTNFKLTAGGEKLTLLRPGGEVAHAFDPYPRQFPDISYGIDHLGNRRFFDRPSPGGQNNVGLVAAPDPEAPAPGPIGVTEVDFSPENPGPGDRVHVIIWLEDPLEATDKAWFSHGRPGRKQLEPLTRLEAGVYSGQLTAGGYRPGEPFEIVAEDDDGFNLQVLVPANQAAPDPDDPEAPTPLRVIATLPSQPAQAIDTGPLLTRIGGGGPADLVTVNRERGALEIRAGNGYPHRFHHPVYQSIKIPGGPRSVRVTDLDGDGWNDLVVALQYWDKVVAFRNNRGQFDPLPDTEVFTGDSPRDMVSADFNGDGQNDIAVINRGSQTLSVVLTVPDEVAFGRLDHILPTDGKVSGLVLVDVDGDGHDDIVQLHRLAGDLSVRLFLPDEGGFDEPDYYPFDDYPSAPGLFDCNNDDLPDVMVGGITGDGTIEVRLNLGDGTFGPVIKAAVPSTPGPLPNRGYIGLAYGDLDADGNADAIATYHDCQVGFFQGDGEGGFTHTGTYDGITEDRGPLGEDIDGDGDIDLVGFSHNGDLLVFENPGPPGDGRSLLDLTTLPDEELEDLRTVYPSPDTRHVGARDLRALDINGDDDLDLVAGTGYGVVVYLGGPGVTFERQDDIVEGTGYRVSGLALGDFNGDGRDDLAVSCTERACVEIYLLGEAGAFEHELTVDVPAGDYIAAGDIDRDGFADLVGAGDGVLWVALSGAPAQAGAGAESPSREPIPGPVINELLAINSAVPVGQDGGRNVDYIELFHGGAATVDLSGWHIWLDIPGEPPERKEFVLPDGLKLDPGDHLVLLFSPDMERSALHTGFRLPGGGATLMLADAEGAEVDRVTYPAQQPNLAFGRFEDGIPGFAFNATPSPGTPNPASDPVLPTLSYEGFDQEEPAPVAGNGGGAEAGRRVRFFARAGDDVGVVNVSLFYRRAGDPDATVVQVVLFDDGFHADGARLDGLYSNRTVDVFGDGERIEFFFEATDLTGEVVALPADASFAAGIGEGDAGGTGFFSLVVGPVLPLQIEAVVADNENGLRDEFEGTPDYLVVGNTGFRAVELRGVSLAKAVVGDPARVFHFLPGENLGRGERVVVFLDNNPEQGDRHAPFRADADGDFFALTFTDDAGVRSVLDRVTTPPLGPDEAFRRVAGTGVWVVGEPGGVEPLPWTGSGWDGSGGRVFGFVFPTEPGRVYEVRFESTPPVVWEIVGDGRPKSVAVPVTPGFVAEVFELVVVNDGNEPPVLEGVTAAAYSAFDVEVRGTVDAGGIPALLTLHYSTEDAGAGWEHAVPLGSFEGAFVASAGGLEPGITYRYSLRAAVGAAEAWSPEGTFTTAPAFAPHVSLAGEVRAGARRAAADVVVSIDPPAPVEVTVFWGTGDGGLDPEPATGWARSADWGDSDGTTEVVIDGLAPGTVTFFRIRARTPDGAGGWVESWTAPGTIVRTLTEHAALKRFLMISEIHYHPPDWVVTAEQVADGITPLDFEFIELLNTGDEVLDLSELWIRDAVLFAFPTEQKLDPGGTVLVVRNREVFEGFYGEGLPVAGSWFDPNVPDSDNRFANDGETLVLSLGAEGPVILDITYDDRSPWPRSADGDSFSMTLIDPVPGTDLADASTWAASAELGGTPGWVAPAATRSDTHIIRRRFSRPWAELADFDRDGDIDVVGRAERGPAPENDEGDVADEERLGHHFLNIGREGGGLRFERADITFPPAQLARAVDFDRDTYPDLFFHDANAAEFRLFLNVPADGGGRTFEEVPEATAALDRTVFASGVTAWDWADFDGDGYPDLLLHRRDANNSITQVWQNALLGGDQNVRGFSRIYSTAFPLDDPQWVDGDGDGYSEVRDRGGRVVLNRPGDDGARRFSFLPGTPGLPDNLSVVAWLDLDGDADLDLLARGGDGIAGNPRWTRLYLNGDPGAGFTDAGLELPALTNVVPEGCWVDDVDGDGDPDIHLGTVDPRRGGELALILVNEEAPGGGGRTLATRRLPVPGIPLAADDFDGDGDKDYLVRVDDGILVLESLGPVALAPVPDPSPIVITEIMYHAEGGDRGDPWDFVEFANVSGAPVDLHRYQIVGDLFFDFAESAFRWLPPEGRALVVADLDAFTDRYGPVLPVAGEFTGRLSNRAGTLTLMQPARDSTAALEQSVFRIAYDDSIEETDGEGFSLEVDYLGGDPFWGAALRQGTRHGSPGDPVVRWTGFGTWQRVFFSAGDVARLEISGLRADPDGDGIPNVQEYAFGTDPLDPHDPAVNPVELAIVRGAGGDDHLGLRYRYHPQSRGAKFQLFASPDLDPLNWSFIHSFEVSAGQPTPQGERVTVRPNGDGTATVTVWDAVPVRSVDRRFLRLEIPFSVVE